MTSLQILSEGEEGKRRMDAILKLDANALLATIRELEAKLNSAHQIRQEKTPAWATALEKRLEEMEKWRNSLPTTPPAPSATTDDTAEEKERERDGLSSNPPFSPSSSFNALQSEELLLLLEQRLLNKVRGEVSMKVENLSLLLSDQLLNTSLEMDRLHKLLLIRPTSSELQQVVLSQQLMEETTSKQIQSIYHTLQSKIKDSISLEMVQLLSELKSHQQTSSEKMEGISKLIHNYSQELQQLQKNEQRSFHLLENSVAHSKSEAMKSLDTVRELLSKEVEEKFQEATVQNDRLTREVRLLQQTASDDREKFLGQVSQPP